MDGFVDITAICVFLTGNPVPTLLADVYYHISHRYTKKKGLIAFCAPLLYQWFLEHLPKTGAWVEQSDVGLRDWDHSDLKISLGTPKNKSTWISYSIVEISQIYRLLELKDV
jgi:hypothetical protein